MIQYILVVIKRNHSNTWFKQASVNSHWTIWLVFTSFRLLAIMLNQNRKISTVCLPASSSNSLMLFLRKMLMGISRYLSAGIVIEIVTMVDFLIQQYIVKSELSGKRNMQIQRSSRPIWIGVNRSICQRKKSFQQVVTGFV